MLPVPGGDKEWYLYAARTGLPLGVVEPPQFYQPRTIARCEGSDKSARAATPIFTGAVFAGLRDSVENVRDFGRESATLTQLDAELALAPGTLRPALELLQRAAARITALATLLDDETSEFKTWVLTLKADCDAHLADLLLLAPWLALRCPDCKAAANTGTPTTTASVRLAELLASLKGTAKS